MSIVLLTMSSPVLIGNRGGKKLKDHLKNSLPAETDVHNL